MHCGVFLQPGEKRICGECGTELEEDMEICPVCGCPTGKSEDASDDVPQQVEVTGVCVTKRMKKIVLIAGAAIVLGIL